MIINLDHVRGMLSNAELSDIYISHRVNGESFRDIATRYKVHHTTIFNKYERACAHVAGELEKELTRHKEVADKLDRIKKGQGKNKPLMFYADGHSHRYTFRVPAIRPFVLSHCNGLTLNAFAGPTELVKQGVTFVSNDIDMSLNTNFHLDVCSETFVRDIGIDKFDTVLLDPPFSTYLAKRKYEGRWYRDYTLVKNNINRLTKIGSKVVSLGFNSTGMGSNRGFRKQELLIVNCKGNHNDIMVLVEQKVAEMYTDGETYEVVEM